MLKMGGYFKIYYTHVQNGKTHKEAYYACEDELEKYNLPPFYTSYESFKNAKSRYMNKSDGPVIRFI